MLNPHQLPALRALAPFIVGILLGTHVDFGWRMPFIFLCSFLLVFVYTAFAKSLFRTELPAKVSLGLLFLAMGYLACWFKQELHDPNHFSREQGFESEQLICVINNAPELKENWVRATARATHLIAVDTLAKSCSGNVLLYLERDSSAEKLSYGDVILLQKAPQLVRKNTNPDAFDYSRYLHHQNIHFQSFARNGEWRMLASDHGNPILAFSLKSQRHLVKVLRKYLPTPDEFAVGSALLLGYREEISDSLRDAYAQTGAMHVLAVSGLHVGIVFLILSFSFGKIKSRSRFIIIVKTALILIGIWAFALLTGAAPSVMRAATMFSLLAIGQALERTGAIYNTLMVSALILLIINPLWLASVGFQLSYLAVFGIVYFQRRFERMIWVPKGFLRKIWTLITVSLAAQLTTGPISIYYFRQFPVFFWLSSLFLVPAAAVLMSGGLLLVVLDWLVPDAAFYVGKALWGMIWLCNQMVYLIQSIPGALISDLFITRAQTILLYLMLVTTMVFLSHRHRRSLVVSAAMGMFFLASTSFRSISNSRDCELVVYDKYRNTVIELYYDRNCYRISPEIADPSELEYTVTGHHQRLGIKKVYDIGGPVAVSKDSVLIKDANKLLFGGLRILHLNAGSRLTISPPTEVDMVIVSDNAGDQLPALLAGLKCKQVVFDSSNKNYLLKEYTQVLDSLKIKYHSIPTQGAFQLRWKLK